MPGSSAGLNLVVATLISLNASATAVASPLTGYGTLGINDSGMALNEAQGFTKWKFTASGGGTGYTVTLYGTNDPLAKAAWRQSHNPGAYPGGVLVLPASSWVILGGPSEQSGTGLIANPITATTPTFDFSGSLLAVRAVLTAVAAPSGIFTVNAEAVP